MSHPDGALRAIGALRATGVRHIYLIIKIYVLVPPIADVVTYISIGSCRVISLSILTLIHDHLLTQVSFLAGMVQLGGAGSYMTDSAESTEVVRVTLKYESMNNFEELSMNHLGNDKIVYPQGKYLYDMHLIINFY